MSTYIYGSCRASKLPDEAHMVRPADVYRRSGWVPFPVCTECGQTLWGLHVINEEAELSDTLETISG